MHYAAYNKYDAANGTGLRASLFVSGCSHQCPGCFNKEAWDFNYGKEFTTEFEDEIIEDLKNEQRPLRGLSILGGEPFDNVNGLIGLVVRASSLKDVWVWSGYTFEEILADKEKKFMLEQIDVLVDGKFIQRLHDPKLRFKGSSNQRIIDVQESLNRNAIVILG